MSSRREGLDYKTSRKRWEERGAKTPLESILVPEGPDEIWEPEAFFATGRAEISSTLTYLTQRGFDIHTGDALDFGCGVGRLTQALSERFDRVVGVDISDSMVKKAQSLIGSQSRVRFVRSLEPNLSFLSDKCIDFVYSNITLQHIDPRVSQEYIREFIRVLKAGGVAVFQLPVESLLHRLLPIPVLKGLRKLLYSSSDPDLFGLTPIVVDSLVRMSGGRLVDVQQIRGTPAWGVISSSPAKISPIRGYPITLSPYISYRYVALR